MPRLKAKVDGNQADVVNKLRLFGFHVVILSQLGKGVPDLIVSNLGITVLVELKANEKSQLTEDEIIFFEKFKGHLIVCDRASQIVGFMLAIFETLYKQNDFVYDKLWEAYSKISTIEEMESEKE